MADYTQDMSALQKLMDEEEAKQTANINQYKQNAVAGYNYGAPRIEGAADVLLGYKPQNMANEAMRMRTAGDEMRIRAGGKNVLGMYKAIQDKEKQAKLNEYRAKLLKIAEGKKGAGSKDVALEMIKDSLNPQDEKTWIEENSPWFGANKTSEDYMNYKIKQYEDLKKRLGGGQGTTPLSPTAPQLSVEDQEALAWAKANSSDPRAVKIMQRLGK